MQDEDRKLSRDLGWIIALGVLGVIAAYLLDPGPCDEQAAISSPGPAGYFADPGYRCACASD